MAMRFSGMVTVFYLFFSSLGQARSISEMQPEPKLTQTEKELSVLTVENNPYKMIEFLAEKLFQRVNNEHKVIQKDPNHLKKIIRQELLPYVDARYASYKVLGSFLKQTSAQERDSFVEIFTAYIITNYSQIMTLYSNQKFTVEVPKNVKNIKFVSVGVTVQQPNQKKIMLAFKLRKQNSGGWKIFDLVAENISMLVTKQSEIHLILRKNNNNINVVMQMLKEKASQDIVISK
jgi:phospholipid transport system substrate-binding protein